MSEIACHAAVRPKLVVRPDKTNRGRIYVECPPRFILTKSQARALCDELTDLIEGGDDDPSEESGSTGQ